MKNNEGKLTRQEYQDFLKAVKLISQPKFRENFKDLSGIIRKISDSVETGITSGDPEEYDFIDFEKSPESWGNDFLAPLIKAITDKSVVEIYYQPFYEEKPYFTHVHPYLLREYRSRWYLIGLNDQKKELRTYGLDRIWEIKVINKEYIPRNFNAREYFRNTVGVISPTGSPPEIRINVRKPQAQYLVTQPLHSSQNIDSEDEESITFTYKVHPTYEFKSILMSHGSDLKVLGPAGLREEMIRELKSALDRYSSEN